MSRPVHADSMCVAMGLPGLLGEPVLEDLNRLVGLAERAVRQRQQPARFGMLRPERDHSAETGDGFSRALQAVQQDAEIRVRVDVLRIQLDRGPVRRFGLNRLLCRAQQHAQIAVGIRVARVQGNGAVIGRDRFVQTTRLLECNPEVAVPVRRVRQERQTLLDQLDTIAAAPALMREHPGEVQGGWILAINLENRLVHDVSFFEPIVLMEIDGDLQGLGDREFARRLLFLEFGGVFEQLLHMLTKHR